MKPLSYFIWFILLGGCCPEKFCLNIENTFTPEELSWLSDMQGGETLVYTCSDTLLDTFFVWKSTFTGKGACSHFCCRPCPEDLTYYGDIGYSNSKPERKTFEVHISKDKAGFAKQFSWHGGMQFSEFDSIIPIHTIDSIQYQNVHLKVQDSISYNGQPQPVKLFYSRERGLIQFDFTDQSWKLKY